MIKNLRTIFSARRSVRKNVERDEAQALLDRAVSPPPAWSPERSYKKAVSSATNTGAAVIITGGPIAAALLLIRLSIPALLPWPTEADPAVVAAITTLFAPLLALYRKWEEDREKHS